MTDEVIYHYVKGVGWVPEQPKPPKPPKWVLRATDFRWPTDDEWLGTEAYIYGRPRRR